jgi:hypothetical protein
MMLNHGDVKIYSYDMDNSGFIVVLEEKVVHRSRDLD